MDDHGSEVQVHVIWKRLCECYGHRKSTWHTNFLNLQNMYQEGRLAQGRGLYGKPVWPCCVLSFTVGRGLVDQSGLGTHLKSLVMKVSGQVQNWTAMVINEDWESPKKTLVLDLQHYLSTFTMLQWAEQSESSWFQPWLPQRTSAYSMLTLKRWRQAYLERRPWPPVK